MCEFLMKGYLKKIHFLFEQAVLVHMAVFLIYASNRSDE